MRSAEGVPAGRSVVIDGDVRSAEGVRAGRSVVTDGDVRSAEGVRADRSVVTDGDVRSAEGVRAGKSVAGMSCEQVDRQADPTHLEQALFRNVMKATFSERMFPGATAATRKD